MSFQRYQVYRDSGVEWIGTVPAHWTVCSLKRAFAQVDYGISDSLTSDGGVAVLRMGNIERGRIIFDDLKYVESVDPDLLLGQDDLLFNRTNSLDQIGKVGLLRGAVGFPITFASYLVRLRLNEDCSPAFMSFMLNSPGVLGEARARAFVAIGQCNLNPTRYGEIVVALPPAVEQAGIAAFLDRETVKIDELVEAQQRLIQLLREKRQAAISRAVTRGLDPSVPMKSSGVDWLGDVPAHWEVMPLKRDLKFLTSGSRGWAEHYADDGSLFIRIGNLTRDRIDLDLSDIQRVNVPHGTEGERTRVRPGDLLFSITAYLGSVAVAPDDLEMAFVSQHVALARLTGERLLPRWAALVTSSRVGQTYLDMQGYGGTKIQLALDDVAGLLMTVPPVGEQATILATLERQLEQFDLLSREAQVAIERLQERRAALISAAVTGKIDVRGWVAADVRKAVAAEIIHFHARKPTFGRVKNQKLLYLAEAHAGIAEIGGQYERQAAGPYDSDLMSVVERELEAAGVMTVSQPDGRGSTVSYSMNRGWKPDRHRLKAMLGDRLAAFEQVNAKLADLDTRGAEAVATLYAVWNDSLIDGEHWDDARVIRGFLDEWHREKREKFKESDLRTWLGWMRRNDFVPAGRGPRTLTGRLFA